MAATISPRERRRSSCVLLLRRSELLDSIAFAVNLCAHQIHLSRGSGQEDVIATSLQSVAIIGTNKGYQSRTRYISRTRPRRHQPHFDTEAAHGELPGADARGRTGCHGHCVLCHITLVLVIS